MSDAQHSPPNPKTRSVALAAERARRQRVERLKKTLDDKLVDPIPAVDALMAELADGAPQLELWEKLHAAAARDGVEAALGDAYRRAVDGPRMKRLPLGAQVEVLVRAADYAADVLRDEAGAQAFLEAILERVPNQADAFTRVEQRLASALDPLGLLELYANAAKAPPRPVSVLAAQAFNRVLQVPAKAPLPEETCRKLLALVPANPPLLHALDRHACATKRHALACSLIESALEDTSIPESFGVQWRERLIDLYTGEAASPASAMEHVEELLRRDPAHASALEAAERLLATKPVSSRAAAVLRNVKKSRPH
jgi:hypothetical protein